MKDSVLVLKKTAFAAVAASALIAASCARPPQPAAPAPAAATQENGRFQIIVSSEGERGSVLFLVDTKDGATWIYRPPVGPAINGYWSDIPRLTYPPEVWQRAIQMLMQPPPSATSAPPAGATAPGTTTPPAPNR